MMNKTLLTAFSLFAAATSFAQPTLTGTNNNPVVGETFYGHDMDTTGKQKGAAGANVTWTFAGATTTLDTTTYIACAGTPSCDSFPTSNLVSKMDDEYTYYSASSGALTLLGANDGGQLIKLNRTLKLFTYPFTYNSTFRDTGYAIIDAGIIEVHLWTMTNTTADAWGTLTTPSGTFPNALRVHSTMITKDSVDLGGMPSVNYNATETYSWYIAGFHNPLLTMTYDTAGTGTSYLSEIQYFTKNGPTAVTDVQHTQATLRAYPTPAAEDLHISWSGITDNSVTITISDMTGRNIVTQQHASTTGAANDIILPVQDYAAGIYLLNMRSSNQSLTQKIMISK